MKIPCPQKKGIAKWATAVSLATLLALTGCVTTSDKAATTSDPVASDPAATASSRPATAPQDPLTPEQQAEIVKKRFYERWDAMIAKDFEKAYSYLSPATRALVSLGQFTARYGRGQQKKVEFLEATCESDACAVRFLLTYDHTRIKDITTPTGEKWFFLDGEAWFNIPER